MFPTLPKTLVGFVTFGVVVGVLVGFVTVGVAGAIAFVALLTWLIVLADLAAFKALLTKLPTVDPNPLVTVGVLVLFVVVFFFVVFFFVEDVVFVDFGVLVAVFADLVALFIPVAASFPNCSNIDAI